MSDQIAKPLYTLGADEKLTQVMVQTPTALCWGEVITKQSIRVSTWLRTSAAPDFVCLYNAKSLTITNHSTPRPMNFSEMYIPTNEINVFHMLPPARDPLDYDPSEPNRRMDPVSVMVGFFKVDGFMRMSAMSNLGKYIEVTRETYTPVYDCEIATPVMPGLGVMRVPYVLLRQNKSIFADRPLSAQTGMHAPASEYLKDRP